MSGCQFILYIPEVALEKIFSFLSYDEIAKNRAVCRKFNEVGSCLLSRGFIQFKKKHSIVYKRVKSLLPRRESERRAHPLARHCDVLQAVETRISMLDMTYMKYIETNLLCFIPGKVLDEMINVLALIESDTSPPRTHQLLQELRDLSSMAMEHFDEHILPRVRESKLQMVMDEKRHAYMTALTPRSIGAKQAKQTLVQQATDIQKIKKQYKSYKHHIASLNQTTQRLFQKVRKQTARLKAQSQKILEQERKINDQTVKIQEQEGALTDIKKHLDEWDQKYKDLTTELIRAREDIVLKTLGAKKIACSSPPKFFKATIKPRMAQIWPRNYSAVQFDLDRKRKSNLLPDIPVKISRNQSEEQGERNKTISQLIQMNAEKKEGEGSQSHLSYLIENLIKTPLNSIKSRKRKSTEEIDLK